MKYVGFLAPNEVWDGLDWVSDLFIDKSNYDFYLIESKTPQEAREKIAEELYQKDFKKDVEYVIERAFWGFCSMEYEEDQEIYDFFGEKDGKTVFEFYDKHTWDAFIDDTFCFYGISHKKKPFPEEDREKFSNFDKENLKKLYKIDAISNILVMPIKKELK
ncbi:MAG: hypothetical protein IKL42_00380 [Clostridia bacterium]|nr:hypothetical protein [Clostridia bacterium]MBR3575842.1 hypothetical protein [Clostridia bacterium]